MSVLLEVSGLRKHFRPQRRLLGGEGRPVRAVQEVTFSVHSGESFALVGESGCGKSTVARCIVGLIEPDAGSIRVAGEDLATVRRTDRRRAFRALERPPESIADLWQVHSAEVVAADRPFGENGHSPQADALVTDNPEVTLFLRFADCVPILAYDPRRRAIGLAHAGWKGTVIKTAAAMIQALQQRYGTRPEDIRAAIGPSMILKM